jgi:hypothetical protein
MMKKLLALLLPLLFFFTAASARQLTDEVRVERVGFNKQNNQRLYEMNISYPIIHFGKEETNHQVNLGIQHIMSEAISVFKRQITEMLQNNQSGFSYLHLDYEIMLNKSGLISIRFTRKQLVNNERNAQPVLLYLGFNYDLTTGEVLRIEDLFAADTEPVKLLNPVLKKNINHCRYRPEFLLRSFTLNQTGLVLSMDDRSANSNGCPPQVELRWAELEPLVAHNGVRQLIR